MRAILRSLSVAAALGGLAVTSVGTASVANASSPICVGKQGTVVFCMIVNVDPSSLPTIDAHNKYDAGCYYLGSAPCTEVYLPQPVSSLGDPKNVVTYDCGGYIGTGGDIYCE